ncbi:hypothetical protein [Microtetraspora fusca]|uniref:hypothetical protein n=1 Tax=Microtetraspora fusca TaxID=1997 RepID=UPI00082F52B7|nr:hypothetical protein [Microtetraspora fusca]
MASRLPAFGDDGHAVRPGVVHSQPDVEVDVQVHLGEEAGVAVEGIAAQRQRVGAVQVDVATPWDTGEDVLLGLLKPELVLGDAVNNDVLVVRNEEFCLVCDRKLGSAGLIRSGG